MGTLDDSGSRAERYALTRDISQARSQTTTRRGVSCGRPMGQGGAPPLTNHAQLPGVPSHSSTDLPNPIVSPHSDAGRYPRWGAGGFGTSVERVQKAPDRLRSGMASVAAPRPPTGAHKRRPYMVPAGAGPGTARFPTYPLSSWERVGVRANRQRSLSSYRGHPVPVVGRSLTRLAGDTRYPRWGRVQRGCSRTLASRRGVSCGRPIGQGGARPCTNYVRPTGEPGQFSTDLPDSIRYPHPHSSSPTPIGDPFGYGPARRNHVPHVHPPARGRPQETPLHGPSRGWAGNSALPHIPPLLLGEGWGEGQSTTLSIVLPGTPGTHGGAGYSADAAALWPPVGASLVGARLGRVGRVHAPTTSDRQANPANSRPTCRTRSGTHTRTRLPRLRSGTPLATARLHATTFTPRSPPPRAPTRDAPTWSQPGLGREQRASPHTPSPLGRGLG